MSFHLIIRILPLATLSRASVLGAILAFIDWALLWDPLSMAACISLIVQFRPQSTGQPSVAYRNSSSAAGWSSAPRRGYIRFFGLRIGSIVLLVLVNLLCEAVRSRLFAVNACGSGILHT